MKTRSLILTTLLMNITHFPAPTFAAPLQYTISNLDNRVQNFVMKMESHILRIAKMGEILLLDSEFLTAFPEFKSLNPEIVVKVLLEHDATKVRLDDRYAQQYQMIESRNPFPEFLTEKYNKAFETEEEFRMRDRLNQIDEAHIQSIMKALGLADKEQQLILKFEKVLDLADRYLATYYNRALKNPMEYPLWGTPDYKSPLPAIWNQEFQKYMTPASSFLKDPGSQRLAQYIETHFNFHMHVGYLLENDYRIFRKDLANKDFRLIKSQFFKVPRLCKTTLLR